MERDYTFDRNASSETFSITPLGAAMVEALPNQQQVRTIKRQFKKQAKCPPSGIFNAQELVTFYAARGQQITST